MKKFSKEQIMRLAMVNPALAQTITNIQKDDESVNALGSLKDTFEKISNTKNKNDILDSFLAMMKGEDGHTPVKGEDYFTQNEIDDFIKQVKPIKGKDYFTDSEISEFKKTVTPQKGKDYFTDKEAESFIRRIKPVKGVDYFDGEPGKPGKDGENGKITNEEKKQIEENIKKEIPKSVFDLQDFPKTSSSKEMFLSHDENGNLVFKKIEKQTPRIVQQYPPEHISGGGITRILRAKDVNVTNIQNGEVLVWDDTQKKFVNATVSGGSGSVSINSSAVSDPNFIDSSDISFNVSGSDITASIVPTLFDGDYNSLANIPSTFTPSAHTHTLADITDSGVLAGLNSVDTAEIEDGSVTLPKIQDINDFSVFGRGGFSTFLDFDTATSNFVNLFLVDGTTRVAQPFVASNFLKQVVVSCGIADDCDVEWELYEATSSVPSGTPVATGTQTVTTPPIPSGDFGIFPFEINFATTAGQTYFFVLKDATDTFAVFPLRSNLKRNIPSEDDYQSLVSTNSGSSWVADMGGYIDGMFQMFFDYGEGTPEEFRFNRSDFNAHNGIISLKKQNGSTFLQVGSVDDLALAPMPANTVKVSGGTGQPPNNIQLANHSVLGRNGGNVGSINAGENTILRRLTGNTHGYGKIVNDLIEDDTIQYNKLNIQPTSTSSDEVSFVIPRTFGTPASPRTANITESLTSAQAGIVQKIYHNAGTAPTFPAGWVRLGSGEYETGELNIIYCEWVSGTRVEYWIVQEA
jgi:hypothetical protein